MQSEARMSSTLQNELFIMEMHRKKANERSYSDVLTEILSPEIHLYQLVQFFGARTGPCGLGVGFIVIDVNHRKAKLQDAECNIDDGE